MGFSWDRIPAIRIPRMQELTNYLPMQVVRDKRLWRAIDPLCCNGSYHQGDSLRNQRCSLMQYFSTELGSLRQMLSAPGLVCFNWLPNAVFILGKWIGQRVAEGAIFCTFPFPHYFLWDYSTYTRSVVSLAFLQHWGHVCSWREGSGYGEYKLLLIRPMSLPHHTPISSTGISSATELQWHQN